MTKMLALSKQTRLRLCGWLAACALAATAYGAQTPAPRILSAPNSAQTSLLKGSLHPFAQARFDAGRMPSGNRLNGMSIFFNRTPAQQADLKQLLADQQDPSSPLYHHWLSPQQFAARFGMAQSDLDKVTLWLQQQGFSVDSVSNSRNLIRFSGTVGQVEQAFQTQMHYYNVGGQKHYAPSTALSLPAAFVSTVANVGNLNDFRPRAMYVPYHPSNPRAAFTSSQSGSVFFAPKDIWAAYDINPLLSASTDGTGQTIVIVGQSAVSLTDVANFQSAAGLASKPPTLVLVPGSGTPVTVSGDQGESDLDLEWSSAMAPGANVYFVYTGNNTNYNVFDAIKYAVDNKIGNVISISYGACEAGVSSTAATALENVMSQGAAQGQSIVAASGDQGSTSCSGITSYTTTQQQALAVNYPASSQYVTGIGGTEITSASEPTPPSGNQYFSGQASTDSITSVLKYIPEVAWNDDDPSYGLSATGGGISTLSTSQPTWQKGYFTATSQTNPGSNNRLVPDVSFYSSPNLPGYLYCTSDTSDWNTTSSPPQTASCNNGFRDASSGYLTVAGGTSFASPIFAGMVAILNQSGGYNEGQGLLNPTLYSLAATNAAIFHDVTAGGGAGTTGTGNQCLAGPTYCSTTNGAVNDYPTSTGYDLATGLGSLYDLAAAAAAWPPKVAPKVGTITTVSVSNATPNLNASVTFTITVSPDTGATPPSGNVTLIIDGGSSTGGSTQTVALVASGSAASATYATSFSTTGAHSVIAQFAGDNTFGASTGAASVSIGGSSSGSGSFTLSATNATVSQGSSGSSTVKITPTGGYTGTVGFLISTSSTSLTNACYTIPDTSVSGTSAVTATLTFYTSSADCVGAAVQGGGGKHMIAGTRYRIATTQPPPSSGSASRITQASFGFIALLLAGLVGWRSRKLRAMAFLLALGVIGLTLSACGGGGSGSSSSNYAPKGTYNLTLTGTDKTYTTISAATSLTLTIN